MNIEPRSTKVSVRYVASNDRPDLNGWSAAPTGYGEADLREASRIARNGLAGR